MTLRSRSKEKRHYLTSIAHEVEDRMTWGTNIVISRVAESTSTSSERHHEDDKSKCANILQAIGLDDADCVGEVFCVEKVREGSARLLKVKCTSVNFRNSVLRQDKCLKQQTEFKRVFINPDLTPLQQACRKELLEEYKRRRSNGENIVIFRDCIIPRSDWKNF